MKTEEEKRQMAEKHRFKKMREFKERLDQREENEEGDIRSFTFHHHDIGGRKERIGNLSEKRQTRRQRSDDLPEKRQERRQRTSRDNKTPYRSSENRGGHERFDRSGGGKKNYKRNKQP